jgi:segregation and condensation protein B
MDRDLVRIVSRSDDLGRPLLYGTTKRFLQIFGLRRLEELPMAEQLRRPASDKAPPATSAVLQNPAAAPVVPPAISVDH